MYSEMNENSKPLRPNQLWPVRPKPLPDELLSSWLVRLAKKNGVKLQRFCDCAFGNDRQIWNRDIDRLAPGWLLRELSMRTNVSLEKIELLTLSSYKGKIFKRLLVCGQQRWILPLGMYHRKRLGFGLQFCPCCLAEDREPYFRKRWRIAFYTFCTTHGCMLEERCPDCHSPVAFHRRELGRPTVLDPGLLCSCSECGFDLRRTETHKASAVENQSFSLFREILAELEGPTRSGYHHVCMEFMDVLHQLCKILISRRSKLRLYNFVLGQINVTPRELTKGRFAFEEQSLDERHFIVQLGLWLMVDPANRLSCAWKSGAVLYNYLLKDMESPPHGFATLVSPFNRLTHPRGRRARRRNEADYERRL